MKSSGLILYNRYDWGAFIPLAILSLGGIVDE